MSLAGEYIDAYCPRCELMLAHVVLFEVRGVVSKVKCRTCGTEHKYRGQKPERKREGASVLKSRSSGISKKAAEQRAGHAVDMARWQVHHERLGSDTEIKRYQMADQYAKGDTVRHDTFGIGFVEKVISENRMDVLFRDGIKRMAMNMTAGA